MDSILTFAKENFQLILLFLGLLGVIISFLSLYYEIKKRKRKKLQQKQESKDESLES
jgi:hypothetical protein